MFVEVKTFKKDLTEIKNIPDITADKHTVTKVKLKRFFFLAAFKLVHFLYYW